MLLAIVVDLDIQLQVCLEIVVSVFQKCLCLKKCVLFFFNLDCNVAYITNPIPPYYALQDLLFQSVRLWSSSRPDGIQYLPQLIQVQFLAHSHQGIPKATCRRIFVLVKILVLLVKNIWHILSLQGVLGIFCKGWLISCNSDEVIF